MMRKLILLISFVMVSFYSMSQELVKNVQCYQEGQNIVITYDLYKNADIEISFKRYGQNHYWIIDNKYLSGDVNNVKAGENRKVVWHVLDQFSAFEQEDIVFIVNTKETGSLASTYDYRTFILGIGGFSISPQGTAGLMIGGVKKVGWYVKARTGFSFQKEDVSESFSNTGDSYFFNGENKKRDLSFTGGLSVRLGCPLHLNMGAGFENRALLSQTMNDTWIRNTDHSYKGVVVDGSLMLLIKHFSLMLGVSSCKFKYMTIELGVGVNF